MRNFTAKMAIAVLSLFVLAACSGSARSKLGISKKSPDEFRVISNQPLSVPPDFALRPPGSENALPKPVADNDKEGEAVLFGNQKSNVSSASKGESAFLSRAGASDADSNIRTVLEEDQVVKEEKKEGFFNKLSNTISGKSDDETVVDSAKEKERISKNKEEGKTVTDGETPTTDATEKKSGWLNRILGR